MITKPTVLVLGAGASIPYGYPSGRELLNTIRGQLHIGGESELKSKLVKLGYNKLLIDEFRHELGLADPDSVDIFLENRNEYIELGKLAIALCLIPFEAPNAMFGSKGSDSGPGGWYSYLMRKMYVRHFEEFANNLLSIITFNYDRSLEHYLFTVLKHRFNKNDQNCAVALNAIPIIHVHGRLGSLPWQGDNQFREYGNAEDLEKAKKASQQILVMSEKDDLAHTFEKTRAILARAESVYFLGFGYHETNLRRLGLEPLADKVKMFGTSYGLGKAEWRAISDKWRITFAGHNIDILGLFQDYYPVA